MRDPDPSPKAAGTPSDHLSIDAGELVAFACRLLRAAGMEDDKAQAVAEIAAEGDMIGHVTHGVAMIPFYLDEIRRDLLNGAGTFDVANDRGACFTWNGNRLPGQWLIRQALRRAIERVADHGVVTGTIFNSHHTGALAAYLRAVTDRGLIAIIGSSNPAASRMAPFGGTVPLLTPDPLAAGFPTHGDPVIVDISCSITTTTMTQTLALRGERFPEPWALTAEGELTDEPGEVVERRGSLLPLGGRLKGHKGYGMALIVEMLSQGLSGHGRADAPKSTAQSLFIQVIEPDAFGGREAFVRQSTWLAEACRSNPPAPGVTAVRVPGDSAARKRREALAAGVPISLSTIEELCTCAEELEVKPPSGFTKSPLCTGPSHG